MRAWAEMVGAELAPMDRDRPRPDTRLLLQAALVAKDAGRFRELHYPAYRARWAEAKAVDDPDVVLSLLEGAGLGAAELDRARSDALAARLDADTRAAAERGVFGVPTLFVGDRMFWGNDRFELVRHFIEKQA
jgi:2-hydroxychromene-2-carboxylate isomerase